MSFKAWGSWGGVDSAWLGDQLQVRRTRRQSKDSLCDRVVIVLFPEIRNTRRADFSGINSDFFFF